MNKFSDICVGVAVFNGDKTLKRTLESLKNQSFKNPVDCSTGFYI